MYPNFTSAECRDVEIGRFLRCESPSRYKVDLARSMPHGSEEYKRIKPTIPAATLSARCRGMHSRANMISHTGFVCMDFDKKDDPTADFEALRTAMAAVPFVCYAGASLGGIAHGLFVVCLIADGADHAEAWSGLRDEFERRFGLHADVATKDPTRLRALSYDVDGVFRDDPVAFEPPKRQQVQPAPRHEYTGSTSNETEEAAMWCAREIQRHGINVTADYSEEWIRCGAALKELPHGLDIFLMISSVDARYNEAQARAKFEQCRPMAGVTISTFFWICEQYGIVYTAHLQAERERIKRERIADGQRVTNEIKELNARRAARAAAAFKTDEQLLEDMRASSPAFERLFAGLGLQLIKTA